MTTYCLITVRGEELAGFQPIVGSQEQDAIMFSFGLLAERTRNDATTFAALGVEWVLEKGLRDLEDIETPAGSEVGRWKLVGSVLDPNLKWFGHDKIGEKT